MNERVSIVTPCYNGERFIDNYMKAVMAQSYDNIQLIITDDGSADNSLEKLRSYKEKLQAKGIEYILLHKENGGQPSAFNFGIKKATGKYVVWPDIDDYMHPDFVQKKASYLERRPELDFLISKSAIIKLNRPDKILGYTWPSQNVRGGVIDNKDLMLRLLKDRNIWFEPGAFMARLDSLDKFIKDRHIYDECTTWSGPQTQILMPFFYYGKVGYLDECLYDYHIHENQDHNKIKGREKLERKYLEVEKMLIATIKTLHAPEEAEMIKLAEERMIRTAVCTAFQFEDREWFFQAYRTLHKTEIKDKIRYMIMKYFIVRVLYQLFRMVKHSGTYIKY